MNQGFHGCAFMVSKCNCRLAGHKKAMNGDEWIGRGYWAHRTERVNANHPHSPFIRHAPNEGTTMQSYPLQANGLVGGQMS